MRASVRLPRALAMAAALWALSAPAAQVCINADLVLEINGHKLLPIGFTMPPPPRGKTPEGGDAIGELASAGATFLRTGASAEGWNDAALEREAAYLDAAARHGLYCMPFLREAACPITEAREAQLRLLLNRFKDHPGLGAWKGEDEPEWGKVALKPLRQAYELIKQLDPLHPVVIIHAPRGSVESLRPYNGCADILGADIYPVGYPPGTHSLLTNHSLSLVGEHTRLVRQAAASNQPVWMVLQISWSGVLQPGKTLRMPTFAEERFMTYQALINGARGLFYFGGHNAKACSAADQKLGWNWQFWKRVLRPVIEEIGSKSPLYPALLEPDSNLPVRVTGAEGMEFCVRQVGQDLFILACKGQGPTSKVQFSGLPPSPAQGEVLFEAPRQVQARQGSFSDWFGPFEVHVYRFSQWARGD